MYRVVGRIGIRRWGHYCDILKAVLQDIFPLLEGMGAAVVDCYSTKKMLSNPPNLVNIKTIEDLRTQFLKRSISLDERVEMECRFLNLLLTSVYGAGEDSEGCDSSVD